MPRLIKKFVAVFIAIWLPMFSGNALAVSVAVQTTGSNGRNAVAQQHVHQTPAAHHAQATVDQDRSACHQDSQNSDRNDCGLCHLGCCGYMAMSVMTAEAQLPAQSFVVSSTQFESISLTLLDPPPLARA